MAFVPGRAHFTMIEGRPAVDFGDASIAIFAEWYVNRGRWNFRLYDTRSVKLRASSWVTVQDQADLNFNPRAAVIREQVFAEYGRELGRPKLDDAVRVLQDEAERYRAEEEEITNSTEQQLPSPEDTPLSADEEEEVITILTSPNSISRLKFHLDNLIAGEDENKQTVFILLLSGKSTDNDLKQMLLFMGEAGAGKTTLMTIADLFNVKDVGRFTAHALDYSELAGYEVLRLKEFGMMDSEDQGVSTIKFLSADDKGYTVEYTSRDDETGEMVTRQKRIEPITVATSTTRASVESQFERRCWIFNPDESETQTERIRQWVCNHEKEKDFVKLGVLQETTYDRSKRILTNVVHRIQMCNCLIPFINTLTSVLRTNNLRVRGDYRKVITLIRLYGIFLQNTLPPVYRDGERLVIITPERALEILRFAVMPLVTMATNIGSTSRRLIEAFQDLGIDRAGTAIDQSLRITIGNREGWSEQTARKYLNKLEDDGYLSSDGKKPKTYYLMQDLSSIRRNMALISELLDYPDELISRMRNEAQITLEELSGFRIPVEETGHTLGDYIQQLQSLSEGAGGVSDPPIRNTNSHPDGNNRDNQDIPMGNRDNQVIPINRVYCYYCREDITDLPKFTAVVGGVTVQVCSECNGQSVPPPRILLSERLEMLCRVFDHEHIPVTQSTILGFLEYEHPNRGWTGEVLENVISVAMRDGTLYSPRPGFYMRTV